MGKAIVLKLAAGKGFVLTLLLCCMVSFGSAASTGGEAFRNGYEHILQTKSKLVKALKQLTSFSTDGLHSNKKLRQDDKKELGALKSLVDTESFVENDEETKKEAGSDKTGVFWGRSNDPSNLGIGESCPRDSACESGICTEGWISNGVCVECLSDDDCEGHGESLPGMMPEAFCYASSCSKWKRGHPIGDSGYPIREGTGEETNPMRRQIVDGEAAASLVWHFDLNNQLEGAADLFEANSTHINVPIIEGLLAGYSMHNHAIDEHETGILEGLFMPNEFSIVTQKPKVFTAEKYHTLTYEGPMDDAQKTRVEAELQARDSVEQRRAVSDAISRLQMQTISNTGTSLSSAIVESQQDDVQLLQVRERVRQGAIQGVTRPSSMSDEAIAAFDLAKTQSSLKSNNQCSHFEETDGLGYTDTHIEFPLDTPIVFHKGTSELAPSYYLGFNAGVLLVHYDEESNALEFHFKHMQFGRHYLYDPTAPKSGLWVSPINVGDSVDPVDGRTDEFFSTDGYGMIVRALIQEFQSIPIDYSFFDRSITGTCDQDTLDEFKDLWASVSKELDPSANMFAKLGNNVQLVKVTTEGMLCGSSYMKVDAHEGLVGNGYLEGLVWSHFILEPPAEYRERAVTSTWWGSYEQFYK